MADYLRIVEEWEKDNLPIKETVAAETPANQGQGMGEPPEAPPDDNQPLATGTPDGISALGAACREQIRKKGYCLVRSAILGGAVLGGKVIVVVDSDTRRNLAPAGYVTYTLRELELLAEGYQAGHIVTIGDLRLLHSAKKHLGGVIVQ